MLMRNTSMMDMDLYLTYLIFLNELFLFKVKFVVCCECWSIIRRLIKFLIKNYSNSQFITLKKIILASLKLYMFKSFMLFSYYKGKCWNIDKICNLKY